MGVLSWWVALFREGGLRSAVVATVGQWVQGARPRTLPNAVSPVLVGAGAAAGVGGFALRPSLLALLVAVALIIGVNYANDYSDGIRGADAERVGPVRLVGQKLARPGAVRVAALIWLAVAAAAGVLLVLSVGRWWLLGLGVLCLLAAWFYTGGRKPYGYAGLGEFAVFLFFGPAAVLGTEYVQSGRITGVAVGSAVAVGAFSTAVLVANNLRDIPSDGRAGKRTLAVMLGDRDTRRLYAVLVAVPFLISAALGLRGLPALAGFAAGPMVVPPLRRVIKGRTGRDLVPVLRDTGLAMLVWSIATGIALAIR